MAASPAGTARPRSRGWRNVGPRRRGAATTIASNKVFGGSKTTMTDMRAASGRRMAVVGATVGEKLARFGADVKLGFYTISHPVHPLRRAAAKERNVNVKAAASGNNQAQCPEMVSPAADSDECTKETPILPRISKFQPAAVMFAISYGNMMQS